MSYFYLQNYFANISCVIKIVKNGVTYHETIARLRHRFLKQNLFLSFGKDGLILKGIFNLVSFSKDVQDHLFLNFSL